MIAQQAHQVADDTHTMGLRADEALNLLHGGPGFTSGAGYDYAKNPNGGMIGIPWDVKDINPAKEAQQESAELKKALADPKAAGSREVILDVAQSMAEHQGDSAYMTAFMVSGGIDETVKAANALHTEDGTHDNAPLGKASTDALARFGQATQVMSGIAASGKYPHPAPDYLAPLTRPSDADMWSVGMLFKYGPAGEKWNPQVIADVSGSLLDWRDKQGAMGPVYEAMPPGGQPGYYGDGKAWYDKLGFDSVEYANGKSDRTINAIRANDPVFAVLDKLGDNPQGSRDLLGQDTADAKRHAGQLVDFTWQTPVRLKELDDSDPVGNVLNAAATDRSSAFQDQSGIAASNILEAAAKENGLFENRSQKKQIEYPTFPQNIAVSLAGITAAWADQIGRTATYAGPKSGGYDPKEQRLVVPHDNMVAAMQLFVRQDPSASAMFDSAMHQQLSDAAAEKDSTVDVGALGNMVGLFTKAKNGVSYTEAQQIDEQHKYNTAMLTTVGTLFGTLAVPEAAFGEGEQKNKVLEAAAKKGLKYTQTLALLGRTVTAPNTDPFSTNNAANQKALNTKNAYDVGMSFTPAMAQGLIRSGKLKEPVGRSWYDPKTKTVSVDAWQNTDYVSWYTTQDPYPKPGPMSDFLAGYNEYERALSGT